MSSQVEAQSFVVLGAGVVGLSTALTLRSHFPNSKITIVAKHLPGDKSIEYTSPWAGANWSSMAHDNGPLEEDDLITFKKFEKLVQEREKEVGISRIGMWGIFDSELKDTGLITEETGKIWFDELVGGLRNMEKEELPEGAVFGLDYKSTFVINTQVYLNWLQYQCIQKSIQLVRRHYNSLTSLLSDFPSTTALLNCSALGSLHLTDIRDTSVYPTRGQVLLIAEPKTPIPRMYFRSPKRISPETTYVFPRPLGGGVILGGSRQEGDWSGEVDEELSKDIVRRCCKLCPELGKPEDVQVLSHNVGLRPSRKGGVRIEIEKWADGTPVVHNYGHSGAGYQSSWGTAERAVRLLKKALETSAKL